MDKELNVPKWVLIVWPNMSQMPQNLSDQFVCPDQKVLNFFAAHLTHFLYRNDVKLRHPILWSHEKNLFPSISGIDLTYKTTKNFNNQSEFQCIIRFLMLIHDLYRLNKRTLTFSNGTTPLGNFSAVC